MKALALERLNQTSPYHVRACSEEGFYEFETVHGVQYSVGFMEDEELLPDEDSCTLRTTFLFLVCKQRSSITLYISVNVHSRHGWGGEFCCYDYSE